MVYLIIKNGNAEMKTKEFHKYIGGIAAFMKTIIKSVNGVENFQQMKPFW